MKLSKIVIPPINLQKIIVEKIKTEQKIINENIGLIEMFEKKIEETIGRAWGRKMVEYLAELNKYLPIDSDDSDNVEYIEYLKNGFLENTKNEKYQFALLAFHLMFMSFIYRQFLCLKEYDYQKVKRFCESNRLLQDVYRVFDMSIVQEKQSIDVTACGIANPLAPTRYRGC